jgi:hypothetical protein
MTLYSGAQVASAEESTTLRAARGRARWEHLAPLLTVLLAFMVATDALCTALDLRMLEGARRQIDITQEGNLAAWFSGFVFGAVAFVSALLAWQAWSGRPRRAIPACAWGVVTCAFGFYGITTALAVHDHAARVYLLRLRASSIHTPDSPVAGLFSLEALGALSLLLVCGFMIWALRSYRRAWLLASLGLALMACSPVAERYENRLIGNSNNYVLVSWNQPFRFTRAASDRLWVASHIKEGVETFGAITLLAGLLGYYATLTTTIEERRAAAHARRRSLQPTASDLAP